MMTSLLVLFGLIGVWAAEPVALNNKRVALFYDEAFPWQEAARPLDWYTNALANLGLDARVVNAKALGDETLITRRHFDTVFMPDGRCFPIQAEYTLTAFLAEGGNLVVGELQQEVKAYDEQTGTWSRSYNQDYYTRFSEWQLRRFESLRAAGRRSLDVPLTRSPRLPPPLQALLPPVAGPFASNDWFQILDRINANAEGGPGKDPNLASNILWPLYTLPNGEGADFVGYRHHNLLLNSSTLVLLGKTGRALLKTDAAPGVLAAAFAICELPFPDEQAPDYYQRLFDVQRNLSRLSERYVAVEADLSDAAMAAFYQGRADRYADLKRQAGQAGNEFFALLSDRRRADNDLIAERNFAEQDALRRDILARAAKLDAQFDAWLEGAKPETAAIRRPGPATVTNPAVNTIRVDAAICAPAGLYQYRTHFFRTLRRLGVNTVSCSTMGNDSRRIREYLRDPEALKASEGIAFIPHFAAGDWDYSLFDPVTGEIKDTKDGDRPLDRAPIDKELPAFLADWKGVPIYRLYYGHVLMSETGMNTRYWGARALRDYQAWLAERYGSIDALNRRWQSRFGSFDDIPAPLRQPQTEAEHGHWEDWNQFRNGLYSQMMKSIYDLAKQLDPSLLLSACTSSSILQRPYFGGNNSYDYTKYQDISGMDGTYLDVPVGEWTWFDLTRGIPHYTLEWGPYYVPKSDPRQWKNKLTEEVWALLGGGGIGINCRVWSYGGCSGNSVDVTGLPTLAGWTLKRMIDQVNQFDQLVLDGQRPAAVRILFSNTSRIHDQSWSGGAPATSLHLNAVDNLYGLFRTWHWPARVLAEEALADGQDLAGCRLLIVPQAEYLKPETQQRLLDLVRQGGTVLVEGISGRWDNYGHSNGALFAAARVQWRPAENAVVALDGQEVPLGDSEAAYRLEADPAAGAQVLVRYADQSAAMLSCPIGQGRLIFSGIPLSLLKMDAEGLPIMERIGREAGAEPLTRCKNSNLVVREWDYAGHTWLVCTYPYLHDEGLQECAMTLRRPCKVRDYLLGLDVPSQTDKTNTIVRFVMPVPGIRVFRVDPLDAAELAGMDAPAMLLDAPPDPSAGTRALHLPFDGFLYEGRPIEADGYRFDVLVIGRGEADLTVRKGTETVRRRITADTLSQFGTLERARQFPVTIGGNTLAIFAKGISDILPIGASLEIRETEGEALTESACSFTDSGDRLLLENGLVRVEVAPKMGARVMAFTANRDGINQVAAEKGLKVGITERIWGVFSQSPTRCEVLSNSAESVAIRLQARDKMGDLELVKRLEMARGEAAWTLTVEATHPGGPARRSLLVLHPQLTVGGSADFYDRFFIPTDGGITTLTYRASSGGSDLMVPAQGWAGVVDSRQKIAVIEQFPTNEARTVYVWMGADFYALERFPTAATNVAPGAAEILHTRFLLIPGLTELDAVADDWATALHVPAAGPARDADIPVMVEVGSARAAERPLRLELALIKDGAPPLAIGRWEGAVSYAKPLNHSFAVPRKAMAEAGRYTLKLILSDPKGQILARVEKKM